MLLYFERTVNMKNILIGVFVSVSVLLMGYIGYDEFVKEEKVIYKECNKEELCDDIEVVDVNTDGKINNKTVKIENKDNLLYVNNKKLSCTDKI